MNGMTKHLKANTTPKAYSISGITLTEDKITLLSKDLEMNVSLRELHLSRKNITDSQGVYFAELLEKNKTLLNL